MFISERESPFLITINYFPRKMRKSRRKNSKILNIFK